MGSRLKPCLPPAWLRVDDTSELYLQMCFNCSVSIKSHFDLINNLITDMFRKEQTAEVWSNCFTESGRLLRARDPEDAAHNHPGRPGDVVVLQVVKEIKDAQRLHIGWCDRGRRCSASYTPRTALAVLAKDAKLGSDGQQGSSGTAAKSSAGSGLRSGWRVHSWW